ncbi:hypothetical protein BC938DRAFT_472471 [Jimgerdemannia flammicorona]|uniref:Uncharacterized protein n=1 Tax=Jimgerdemannia flammicorona TaxID=994334 RepID=A0A433Q614_9FUNG|nr:hypothetical protein BC938DRAFT_472471 [Jimgerdemannia flammicorona]
MLLDFSKFLMLKRKRYFVRDNLYNVSTLLHGSRARELAGGFHQKTFDIVQPWALYDRSRTIDTHDIFFPLRQVSMLSTNPVSERVEYYASSNNKLGFSCQHRESLIDELCTAPALKIV